jgi:hypothetical protein
MQKPTLMSNLAPRSKRHLFAGLLVLASLVIGAAAVAPFFFAKRASGAIESRMLATHDLATILVMMEEFDKGLRSGMLYPRWLADINYNYGAPIMVFYPPGLFYLASLIHGVFNDWGTTTFLISAFSLAASGLAMYFLSRVFHGRAASLVAALLYMLLPYHLLDLYWRGALPEFAGFAFLPLILYFFYRSGSEGRLYQYAGLGLFYGLYIMTHLPVSYIFTYALALYALIWAVRNRDWRILIRIAWGMGLGLMVSAIYWLPAALEGKDIYEPVTQLFPYHKSYFETLKLIGDAFDRLIMKTFRLHLITLGILLLALLVSYVALRRVRREETPGQAAPRPESSQTGLWVVMAVVTTLMNTIISMPVSKLIPKIQISVPAWRWMVIVSLFTSLLAGAAFDRLQRREGFPALLSWVGRATIILLVGANIWFSIKGVLIPALSHEEYQRPEEFAASGFIPKDSKEPQNLPKTEKVIVMDGTGEILRWDPMYRVVEVTAKSSTTLRLRTYNFPGWVATVDGGEVPIASDSFGAQVILIPAGQHKVEVAFENTRPRSLGAALSTVGFFGILGLAFFNKIESARRKRISQAN